MKTVRCPTCKRPTVKGTAGLEKLFPSSERCHLIDLGRWLGEEYRVPDESGEGVPSPSSDDG